MTLNPSQQTIMDNLLIEAIDRQDLARMRIYVSKGANVHVSVDTIETVYMNGTSTSRGLAPAYHYMLGRNFSKEISDFFFEQGVAVDVKNFNGNTPLMLAVKNGDLTRAKYFLDKGADPLGTNKRGEIVLEEARKLQTYQCADRQSIIDALVRAMDAPKPAATAPLAKPAAVETSHDIQTLKPIEFAPRKKAAGGFNL